MMTTNSIILENFDRQDKLFADYDPISGKGSVLDRVEVKWQNGDTYYLPRTMLEMDLVKKLTEGKKLNAKQFNHIRAKRLRYDYEYYAAQCQYIKPKEGGLPFPFRLNHAQRTIFLPMVVDFIDNDKPIRMIVPKARQVGLSTVINGVIEWIQSIHRTGWNSCVATLVESQARTIRGMYSTIATHSPLPMTLSPYEGSSKIRLYEERGSTITVGSAEQPDALRSGDYKIAHYSEVGLWKKTAGKEPEDLVQSIRGSIPYLPYTAEFVESTAKGVGNFFHREYLATLEPESRYKCCFVPWFALELYVAEVKDYESFVESWSAYEKTLWSMGATIESISWYRAKLKYDFKGDTWRMFSEYPSTADEAFSSTGQKFFNPEMVNRYMTRTRPPVFVGDLSNKHFKDPAKLLKDLTFIPAAQGNLFIWEKPDTVVYKNRYLTILDTGGKYEKADYSVITVFDRMSDELKLRVVARWRFRDETYIIAYKAMQVAMYYQESLLVIESNFYESRRPEVREMDTFEIVMDKVVENYDNLYLREPSPEQIKAGIPAKYGFHMNIKTKPVAYSTLAELLEQDLMDEPDENAVMEWKQIERKGGHIEAASGLKDDISDTDAIGAFVDRDMPPVKRKDLQSFKISRNSEL